jgi:hypothetical protein
VRLSLDTHVFLWWLDDPQLLSRVAREAIGDGKNTIYVSAVVIWEIVIKRALSKLDAPDDLEAAITKVSSSSAAMDMSRATACPTSLPDRTSASSPLLAPGSAFCSNCRWNIGRRRNRSQRRDGPE